MRFYSINQNGDKKMPVLNRVQLIGHVGQEPKITETNEGKTYATLSLATNEPYKKGEEWETMTEWHNLVCFGKLTSLVSRLKKGSMIFCEGKLRSNRWTDKEGIKRQSTSIVIQNIQVIDHLKPKLSDDGSEYESDEYTTDSLRHPMDVPF